MATAIECDPHEPTDLTSSWSVFVDRHFCCADAEIVDAQADIMGGLAMGTAASGRLSLGVRFASGLSVAGAGAARSPPLTFATRVRSATRATSTLEHSKTRQAGVTAMSTPDKPVLDRAAPALQDWLEASEVAEGAFFEKAMETVRRPYPVPSCGR